MKRKVRLLAGAAIVGLAGWIAACGGAPAQDRPPSGQPAAVPQTPPQTMVLSDLLKDWQEQKDTMMKIADAMPEAKFGYKSTPAQRNWGQQIMHAATTNVDLLKALGGKAPPPSFTDERAKTKADILKALADSYDYGTSLLKEQTEATIGETIDASFLGSSSRARVFWTLLAHSMDVYGQMAVYLRLNGIVPPASRNP